MGDKKIKLSNLGDILIGAVVVNGSVPNFYGGTYESSSNILDIPLS